MINITSNVADEFDALEREIKTSLAKNVSGLNNELIKKTPVQTGNLRKSWDLEKIDNFHWTISNNQEYAEAIFLGRREVPTKYGMKMIGSLQLPDGVSPILIKWDDKITKAIEKIKR